MRKQAFFSLVFIMISSAFSAQKVTFYEKKVQDSVAVNNAQEILVSAKEKFQTGNFTGPYPSDIRINASMLNRNDRNFNPFQPRNFEINNDIHYLPPNVNLPAVGLQKLTEIKIYQSK